MNETSIKLGVGAKRVLAAIAAVALLSVGVLAGSLFTRPAAAQSGVTPGNNISVTGMGEVRVKPDMATLNFQIHVPGATSEEALSAYEKAAAALTARLQALGVAEADIVVQPVSTWPAPTDMRGMNQTDAPGSAGYYSDGVISVTLRDLAKLRDVAMEGLKSEAGIGLSYIQYGLQNDTAARDEALTKAIDNARSQADAVAAKLGLTVGEVTSVNVQPNYVGVYDAYGKGGAMPVADPSAQGANFSQLGTRPDIMVNLSVQVSYNFQ